MKRKKISLGIFLVLLGLIATGQVGTSGCQCPGPTPSGPPAFSYDYKVPYCTANNGENDRVALFCYVEVLYYDAQDNKIGTGYKKDLVKVIRGSTLLGEPSEQFPPADAIDNFKRESFQLNIPDSAVKAKVNFHVGAHYLLNDGVGADHDDGIEALLKNVYVGNDKVTGWDIGELDYEGVDECVHEIGSDGTLRGRIVGGGTSGIDQGFVTFFAEVPLT